MFSALYHKWPVNVRTSPLILTMATFQANVFKVVVMRYIWSQGYMANI